MEAEFLRFDDRTLRTGGKYYGYFACTIPQTHSSNIFKSLVHMNFFNGLETDVKGELLPYSICNPILGYGSKHINRHAYIVEWIELGGRGDGSLKEKGKEVCIIKCKFSYSTPSLYLSEKLRKQKFPDLQLTFTFRKSTTNDIGYDFEYSTLDLGWPEESHASL